MNAACPVTDVTGAATLNAASAGTKAASTTGTINALSEPTVKVTGNPPSRRQILHIDRVISRVGREDNLGRRTREADRAGNRFPGRARLSRLPPVPMNTVGLVNVNVCKPPLAV